MDKGTKNILGWSQIVLAVLVALNVYLGWPGYLQYLWATLVVITGAWTLSTKE